MGKSTRCPFCHDALAADAEDRVECAGCAAGHHAECFAEHGSCAATACGSVELVTAGSSIGNGDVYLKVAAFSLVAAAPALTFGAQYLIFAAVMSVVALIVAMVAKSIEAPVRVRHPRDLPLFDGVTGEFRPNDWEQLLAKLREGTPDPEGEDEEPLPTKVKA